MFNDIFTINQKLEEANYFELDNEHKKELVDKELYNYLYNKLSILYNNSNEPVEKILKELCINSNTMDLLTIINSIIPLTERKSLCNITHFILAIAGSMQGCSITWYESDENEPYHIPNASFVNSHWDKIYTHKKNSDLIILNFVYDVFMNHFIVKEEENQIKKLK